MYVHRNACSVKGPICLNNSETNRPFLFRIQHPGPSESVPMRRFSAAREWYRAACRLCTTLVLACLLTTSVGAVPVLLSLETPESQSPSEQLKTHSDVRVHCPRRIRRRSLPVKPAAPLDTLCVVEASRHCWRLPQPLFLPCHVGLGIRLRC